MKKWWMISLLGVMFLIGQAEWAKAWGLSIEERVACQRAIEEVYWSHTLWPKENPSPKPQLKEVMSEEELRKKVEETVKMSKALEVIWKRPVRGYQLQAELQRMAETTRNPNTLRELCQSLGNDPHLIAECLARPLLVERQIQEWYSFDERFHGRLKKRVMRELRLHDKVRDMKGMTGEYQEVELRKGKSREDNEMEEKDVLELSEEEWSEELRYLAGEFGGEGTGAMELPLGQLSKLQEDEERFYAVEVLEKGSDRVRIAVVEWQKVGFDTWWSEEKERFSTEIEEEYYAYNLPEITLTAIAPLRNTWSATAAMKSGPGRRCFHTAVWTGAEMIVWGGFSNLSAVPPRITNTGSRYNPATNTWSATNTTGAPNAREFHTAVWTGTEMIVWGGLVAKGPSGDGGRYDPATNTWSDTTTTGAPRARYYHTAVWTGTVMIVWGGNKGGDVLNTGGRYDPATNTWSDTTTTGAPSARVGHTVVWADTVMIVWGGVVLEPEEGESNDGGRYDPAADTWSATTTMGAPEARATHTAVWTGTVMIVWGGSSESSIIGGTGGYYNPLTDNWSVTNTTGAPSDRYFHTAVWTGMEMIVWGGKERGRRVNTGSRYDPATNTWSAIMPTMFAPSARDSHTAVWTDREMIVWGGLTDTGITDTGGRYDPEIDEPELSWLATSKGKRSAPSARQNHEAVWTGTEMIVWGGRRRASASDPLLYINTGGRYNPATNAWSPTTTTGAPRGRESHTAVWTGTRMIVWGGINQGFIYLNDGGCYNPATNAWSPTTTMGAPSARQRHTAVWTGTEMIVWGGVDTTPAPDLYFNDGGRYNPATNAWSPTTTTGAPPGRHRHTAVWTGTEMIVWGGYNEVGNQVNKFPAPLNSGQRYNPNNKTWVATTTTGAPEARAHHTAVWTGTEMIVWGGSKAGDTANKIMPLRDGGRYNPNSSNEKMWVATITTGAPEARATHTAVWTGMEMIVWGGFQAGSNRDPQGFLNSGGRYFP